MPATYLHREDAPFGAAVWEAIDTAVVGVAQAQLAGRRLLELEGPFGFGLKSVPLADAPAGEDGGLAVSPVLPLAAIRVPFTLGAREIAAFEQTGLPLDLTTVAAAAMEAARREDELVFHGSAEMGLSGILGAPGACKAPLGTWEAVGSAADEAIGAVTKLDEAGFHGPYAMALPPRLYNQLFRLYPEGNMTELAHLQGLITGGIVKAGVLDGQALVVAVGRQFSSIVIGQDLAAGLVGPDGAGYEFFLLETLTLRVSQPKSLCVLSAG